MWRDAGRGAALVGILVALLTFARQDRRKAVPEKSPATDRPAAIDRDDVRAAIAAERELADTEARLVEARRQLKVAEAKLEERNQEIAGARKPAADEQAAAPARPVAVPAVEDEGRAGLVEELAALRKQLADSQAKADKARQDLEKLRAARPNAPAAKPIDPNTLGRGAIVDQQTKFDPRRFRDPSMPKFAANAAAVAAAGSGGAARGGGVVFPGSTVGGDIARSQAEFVRAAGEYNLNTSKGMINMQTAKSMEIENRLRWTETFFEMRRVNRTARALEAGPRPTMEQVVRYARMQAPRRLSSLELDPITGDISWPVVLQDSPYIENRAFLEEQFRMRAKSGGSFDYAQFDTVEAAFENFKANLLTNVSKYSGRRYGEARNFLDSLKLEFELPVK
jgi:hypothetical protein